MEEKLTNITKEEWELLRTRCSCDHMLKSHKTTYKWSNNGL